MKISVAQLQCTSDAESNRAKAKELVELAAGEGSDLVLFPEMSVLEFFPRVCHDESFFCCAEPIPGPTTEWFAQLARQNNIHIVYNHYEKSPEHLFFDACAVVNRNGEFVGRQRMMHIAEAAGYDEKFYYTPGWDQYRVFDLEGWRFGIAICYDRHFPEVFRSFLLQGAELVLIPTAVAASEPFTDVYAMEMQAAAITHGVYIAMANRVGREDPLHFIGQSMVISPEGKILAQLGAESTAASTVEIDKASVTRGRTRFPFLRDRRPDTYGLVSQSPPL